MISIKTKEEIELLRESSLLVGKSLAEVAKNIQPGITTLELDKIAEQFIRDHGAIPGFKGYGGFPGSLCISVNDEVVHGIPSKRELKDGDIVSVDCGVLKNGFYGDSAYTFAVGEVDAEIRLLMERTKESLYLAVEQVIAGKRTGDIGFAVQNHVEQYGYGVVKDLVGHGIGRNLHEKPEIPNFGRRGKGPKLTEGMVICIEPMINMGTAQVKQDADGWTIRTFDKKPSAHYELQVAVGNGKADVLMTYKYIDQVLGTKSKY
ncbi:MAG: type I methionyl aminopeptidase [Bacteroidales bacterium]|nr:type I methionyl aminopeptidase [Bacteroidales bacterium]